MTQERLKRYDLLAEVLRVLVELGAVVIAVMGLHGCL